MGVPLLLRDHAFFLIVLAIAAYSHAGVLQALATGTGCRVRYESTGSDGIQRPLLFGGSFTGCVGVLCQPRDDAWGKYCNPTGWRRCKPEQLSAVLSAVNKTTEAEAILRFSPCELHSYLKNRTTWVIGDSLMEMNYYAMRCFLTDFWDHQAGECSIVGNQGVEKAIFQSADTNHTSVMGGEANTDMPRCVNLLEGGRICFVHSVRGEEFASTEAKAPGVLQVLQRFVAQSQDLFYVNFGRWHFNNCVGLQYLPYIGSLEKLGQLYESTKKEFPNLFFKISTHDHSVCAADRAARDALTECATPEQGGYSLFIGKTMLSEAQKILQNRYGVPLVNTYDASLGLYQAHLSPGKDCTHWCTPGLPEWELWSFYKALVQHGIQQAKPPQASVGSVVRQACRPFGGLKPPKGWASYDIMDGT